MKEKERVRVFILMEINILENSLEAKEMAKVFIILKCIMKNMSTISKKITIVKKQNYLIISAYADDIEDFAECVQSMIVEGWQLNGGISSSTSMLYQSLRKI